MTLVRSCFVLGRAGSRLTGPETSLSLTEEPTKWRPKESSTQDLIAMEIDDFSPYHV